MSRDLIERRSDIRERFQEQHHPEPNSGCWLWSSTVNPGGYGKMRVDGRFVAAHRLSYRMHNGPIPDGLVVRHKCDIPCCVNPAHLIVGTRKENAADMFARNRAALAGGMGLRLTRADRERVLEAAAAGETIRGIARRFGVTPSTIRQHVRKGFIRLTAENKGRRKRKSRARRSPPQDREEQ